MFELVYKVKALSLEAIQSHDSILIVKLLMIVFIVLSAMNLLVNLVRLKKVVNDRFRPNSDIIVM